MGFLEERDLTNVPTISEYYKGKTVFITGGSGFMGKVLIEKLLYSCSDLDRIYLLMRNKKGVKPEDRLAQLYSSHCFDRLRAIKPTIFNSKVFVVAGDILELGLGLTQEDRALLVNRVNVIFHVAASVRFDDPLPYAVKMNLRGTIQMMELAKEVKNLSSVVHVSTSYSNTNRDPIEEIMYPPHADWRETLEVCETTDEHTLKVLTAKYLGELPNTYTFTKQLAEHVVYEHRGQLPVVIIRPSIVISSMEEPMPGWIENFNGPVGLLVASGKGIMRSLYTNPNLKADYMPVDIAIKCMIATSWIRGTKRLEPDDDIPIYNVCAGKTSNITMGELIDYGRKLTTAMPLNGELWAPGGSLTNSKLIHYVKVFLLHLIPAIVVDTILRAIGKKPLLLKVQRRIFIANLALQYYILHQWSFDNKNTLLLRSKLKPEDTQFGFIVDNVDLYQFFYKAVEGGRKYLLREKDEDLPKARKHHQRMVILDMLTKVVVCWYLFTWLISTNFCQSWIHYIYSIFVE